MPCSDDLWESDPNTLKEHNSLGLRVPNSWQQQIESLPYESPPLKTAFIALSMLSGVVLYADELRDSGIESSECLRDHIKEVFGGWTYWHSKHKSDPLNLGQFTLPLAFYLQVTLEVDIRLAIKMFRLHNFSAMRNILRGGNLAKAYRLALSCITELSSTYCDMALILTTPSGITFLQPLLFVYACVHT